ncbi:hypothetical protein HELRODRAFT_167418 [Helobdella robusta]|uniref:Cadherin domain-containing protein n=1 Tax=Helobdella robusta TaxID=6412 RepID=T1EZC2_HELRO|nr:hypothetical protein HELRODRAFT_167418 [Helobdella robusta]ESO10906.1 hypothetical protein HELRODRAFT_167418 [Helobdella robusta]
MPRFDPYDPSNGTAITYVIISGNIQSAFTIENNALRTNVILDREIRSNYKLEIRATMTSSSSSSSFYVVVMIQVLDVNDNAPSFPDASLVSLSYDAKRKTRVTQVKANDLDLYPPITYTILHGGVSQQQQSLLQPPQSATPFPQQQQNSNNNNNQQLTCDLTSDDFHIETYTGQVILLTNLAPKKQCHGQRLILSLQASDGVYTATTDQLIQIQQPSKSKLRFTRPLHRANITRGATAILPYVIANITALWKYEDDDDYDDYDDDNYYSGGSGSGANDPSISYSMYPVKLNQYSSFFSIGSKTGAISLSSPLPTTTNNNNKDDDDSFVVDDVIYHVTANSGMANATVVISILKELDIYNASAVVKNQINATISKLTTQVGSVVLSTKINSEIINLPNQRYYCQAEWNSYLELSKSSGHLFVTSFPPDSYYKTMDGRYLDDYFTSVNSYTSGRRDGMKIAGISETMINFASVKCPFFEKKDYEVILRNNANDINGNVVNNNTRNQTNYYVTTTSVMTSKYFLAFFNSSYSILYTTADQIIPQSNTSANNINNYTSSFSIDTNTGQITSSMMLPSNFRYTIFIGYSTSGFCPNSYATISVSTNADANVNLLNNFAAVFISAVFTTTITGDWLPGDFVMNVKARIYDVRNVNKTLSSPSSSSSSSSTSSSTSPFSSAASNLSIRYSIQGITTNFFTLDPNTGDLALKTFPTLAYNDNVDNGQNYSFNVWAEIINRSSTNNNNINNVINNISNNNSNNHNEVTQAQVIIFIKPQPEVPVFADNNFKFNLPRDVKIGDVIGRVRSSTRNVFYYFKERNDYFAINRTSGEIKLLKMTSRIEKRSITQQLEQLQRQEQQILTVIARTGFRTFKEATTDVIITLNDVIVNNQTTTSTNNNNTNILTSKPCSNNCPTTVNTNFTSIFPQPTSTKTTTTVLSSSSSTLSSSSSLLPISSSSSTTTSAIINYDTTSGNINSLTPDNNKTETTPSPPPSASTLATTSSNQLSTTSIILLAVFVSLGGIIIILAIVAIVVCCLRNRKRNKQKQQNVSGIPSVANTASVSNNYGAQTPPTGNSTSLTTFKQSKQQLLLHATRTNAPSTARSESSGRGSAVAADDEIRMITAARTPSKTSSRVVSAEILPDSGVPDNDEDEFERDENILNNNNVIVHRNNDSSRSREIRAMNPRKITSSETPSVQLSRAYLSNLGITAQPSDTTIDKSNKRSKQGNQASEAFELGHLGSRQPAIYNELSTPSILVTPLNFNMNNSENILEVSKYAREQQPQQANSQLQQQNAAGRDSTFARILARITGQRIDNTFNNSAVNIINNGNNNNAANMNVRNIEDNTLDRHNPPITAQSINPASIQPLQISKFYDPTNNEHIINNSRNNNNNNNRTLGYIEPEYQQIDNDNSVYTTNVNMLPIVATNQIPSVKIVPTKIVPQPPRNTQQLLNPRQLFINAVETPPIITDAPPPSISLSTHPVLNRLTNPDRPSKFSSANVIKKQRQTANNFQPAHQQHIAVINPNNINNTADQVGNNNNYQEIAVSQESVTSDEMRRRLKNPRETKAGNSNQNDHSNNISVNDGGLLKFENAGHLVSVTSDNDASRGLTLPLGGNKMAESKVTFLSSNSEIDFDV